MRQAEGVTRLARPDDRIRRAACALARRPGRVEPQPERDPHRVRAGAEHRDRAVDAPAHRDGDPPGLRHRVKHARKGVRDRVRGERLAGHGRGLEQRQAGQRTGHPMCVGLDDPLAFDDQPCVRVRIPACRVPRHLDSHRPRLALDRSADPPPNAPPSPRGTPPLIDVKELEGRRTAALQRRHYCLRFTLKEISRRVEMPASRSSPLFRARAKTTSSCCCSLAGKNLSRLIVRIGPAVRARRLFRRRELLVRRRSRVHERALDRPAVAGRHVQPDPDRLRRLRHRARRDLLLVDREPCRRSDVLDVDRPRARGAARRWGARTPR